MKRQRIIVEGVVQGVGFRPFVSQLADRLGVSGWVRNDSRGVTIEAEAEDPFLEQFIVALSTEKPPLASITRLTASDLPPTGGHGFSILASDTDLVARAQIPADACVCADCLRELVDPADRRYRYPFINCTNCGPRFTIVTGIPYDRPQTTMAGFTMCPACRAEYHDPASRRFHAQPNACPLCGPRLALCDASGQAAAGRSPGRDPAAAARGRDRRGQGARRLPPGGRCGQRAGGAGTAPAQAPRREAVCGHGRRSRGGGAVRRRHGRRGPASPGGGTADRALWKSSPTSSLPKAVAPRNRYVGVMLPYTPLHHLLLEADFLALVMTSANLSDEPIAYLDDEARGRLHGIADVFLLHDRPIHTRADDSVARVARRARLLLRRSRGYVPRGIALPEEQPPVLAVGAELKSTVCLTRGDRAFLSQHLGDLQNMETHAAFMAFHPAA